MKNSKIEWCDSSWNPITGCLHDCEYCYARKIANRFKGCIEDESAPITASLNGMQTGAVIELDAPMKRKTEGGEIITAPYPFGFQPTLHRYRLDEPQKWTKPRTIFVCSMADIFGDWVPDEWIEAVFAACEKASQHRYLFLTKNPKRLCELANKNKLPKKENFWFGSTVDTTKSRLYPGRLRDNTFISIEPLLEPLNVGIGSFGGARWIIIGAETGNREGKVIPKKEWIDNICEAADITHAAVFMKDSLLPIVGEANMRREFPWKK